MKNPKYIDVHGTRTRYFEAGQGEPLLLVHGSAFGEADSSADEWEPVFDRFSQSFHVFAIDKIGQGYTDNPRNDSEYLIGATVDHASNFLKALGIERCHVVGHSRGGYTTCRMALEQPELVKGLVIVDSGTLMGPSDDFYDNLIGEASRIQDTKERYRFLIIANSFRENHITEAWLDTILELIKLPKMMEAASKMGPGPMPGSGSTNSKAGVGSMFLEDIVARREETHQWIKAGDLKVPTLVIWGYNDPSAPINRQGIDAMNLILPNTPNSRMHIINEAGHFCFREQPAEFVATVTAFIQSL